MIKRISAHYVFPVSSPPVRYGVVVTDGEGTITEVVDPGGEAREYAGTVFYSGVVVPGFIICLKIAGDHSEEEAVRVRAMLRGCGCRAVVTAFRDRAFREDLLTGTAEEMAPGRAAAAEKEMVVIRKNPGEEVLVRDLFPEPGGSVEVFGERLYRLTLAGARALAMPEAGCLAPGCRPGVIVLEMEGWKVEARSSKLEGGKGDKAMKR